MVEVAIVVVAGTVVAIVVGVKGKNDGRETRETMAYDAYCVSYDVEDGRCAIRETSEREDEEITV